MFLWQLESFCIMDWLNNWLRWSIAGLLLGVGFVLPLLWPVGLLGGAYFIQLLHNETNLIRSCLGAWLAWSVKAAFATSVFWSAYPIEWLPIDFGNTQLIIIFIYWITASAWLGSGAVLVATVYRFFHLYWKGIKPLLIFVVLPVIWVIGEVLGSIVFSVMMMGPGGSINASYSLGYGGYLLAENEVILQFARLGGVYSLSLLFALVCGSLYFLLSAKKQHARKVTFGFLTLIYLTSLFTFSVPEETIESNGYKVISIDTAFPKGPIRNQSDSIQISNSLNTAMLVSLGQKPDYILLPEDARYFNQQRSASAVKSLFKLQFDNPKAVIIDSGRAEVEGNTVLQTFIYNGPDDSVERVHKRYLVPQGEYMPSLYAKLLGLVGYGETANYLSEVVSYEVGSKTSQTEMANNLPGILFCFESVSPYGVRTLIKERPNIPFVAHPISHAWFHDSNILWHQLDTMLKVQAVWNQKYIVSAANHAKGRVVTPQGTVSDLRIIEQGSGWEVSEVIIPKSY